MRTILTSLLLTLTILACQVPVFRYALERWESDPYRLYITTPGDLSNSDQTLVDAFKKQLPHTNLELKIINTSTLKEADLWTLPELNTSPQSPTITLFAPATTKSTSPLITLPLNQPNLNAVIHSPARSAIVEKIISGNSAVWLILHPDTPNQAKKTQQKLSTILDSIEQKIPLPEGIIGTEQRAQIDDKTNLDDVLRSSIPLKIAFTTQVLDLTDPAEKVFVATLLADAPPSIRNITEPIIIPIFGRGRKIAPLTSSDLTEDAILQRAQYLCGACSCQVKEQNPGSDLLIHENWPKHLSAGLAVVEKTLPPLSGSLQEISSNPRTAAPPEPKKESTPQPHFIAGSTLTIGAIILLILAIPTVIILKKSNVKT